jgi:hypothetical protein
MQEEFNAENPNLQIQILGINQAGYSSGNSAISNGRDIPWLQDTVDENVWSTWEHAYRDVIIVDESNQRVGVYNLTTNSLASSANFQALKSMILAEAQD